MQPTGKGGEKPKPEREAGRLRVWTMADCDAAEPRGYIMKGLIAPGDLGVLFGAPGTGKSVVAPYLGHAVAAGRCVFGRRVRQGVVLYVAAEDGAGMKLRANALGHLYGKTDGLLIVAQSVNLMGDGAADTPDLGKLRAVAREHGAVLIVLDTLAAAFPGLDENDGRSMGRVVKVLRDLGAPAEAEGELSAWPGAAVMAVHHAAKGGGTTPRGHGVLDGAADVTMRIEAAEDRTAPRTVTLGKNRNGSTLGRLAFTIHAAELGIDDDGDAITAPVAEEAADIATRASKRPKLAPPAELLLREIHNLGARGIGEIASPCPDIPPVLMIPRQHLRERLIIAGWFAERHLLPSEPPYATRLDQRGHQHENRNLESLKTKGLIGFDRRSVWTI